MDKQKVAIIGSCIGRDVFNKDTNLFEITSYYNFCSIVSWYMKNLQDLMISRNEIGHKSEWFNKCIAADINKSIIKDTLAGNPDWIIIDLMSERLEVAKCRLGGEDVWLTMHDDLKKTRLYQNEELVIGNEFIKWEELDNKKKNEIIKTFCQSLLENIPAERVIFLETFYVNNYVDAGGTMKSFAGKQLQRSTQVNSRLLEMENLILFYLGTNNIIKFPYNEIADENHHLNLSQCHYMDSYYWYAYESIKRICDFSINKSRDNSLYDLVVASNNELERVINRNKLMLSM